MHKFYRNTYVSVMMVLLCVATYAQQRRVTGAVKDAAGTALPGVSILVKGTVSGTTTDAEGKFSLDAASDNVLVISFIGYVTQEIAVGNQTTLDVAMAEDLRMLSEVVVVGYGVQKKTLVTGANLQVKGEDLQKLSTTNALQALQGQAPGVQISSTSGQPGEPIRVIIRGMGTIGDASPLYVVDGVITKDIDYLNPADIESIDVLKDAASAAIYGSQAANGVVLVTTRSGKSGKRAQVTFDAYYGVQNVARKADMLNVREYATIMNEAAVNSGKLPYFTNQQIVALDSGTNWMDEMFVKDAITQNYNIGASGGSDASIYAASLSYTAQEGIVGGSNLSNYERYNFRINTEHRLYNDVLKLGQNLTFTYVEKNGIGVGNQYANALRGAFNSSPFIPMYDKDDEYFNTDNFSVGGFDLSTQSNPYAEMVYANQNRNNDQKLLGNIYLEVQPLRSLKFRTSLGLDYYANERHEFKPVYDLSVYAFNDFTKVTQQMGKGRTWMWDNVLSYGTDLGEHHVDGLVGTSAFQFIGSRLRGSNSHLIFNDLQHAWVSNATNTDATNIALLGGPDNIDKRMSYFARLNYNYRETYMVNASFRADGASRFARGHRWGYFPSVAAGWVLSNESFLSSLKALEFLKLRASWGRVGNLKVGFFQYLVPITIANTNYTFGPEEGVLTAGGYPSRLANPNVKWETSEQTNIGFDARLLAGKITVAFDWYKKTTKDWLIAVPILASSGADAPFINGGDVKNSGIELALSYSNSAGGVNYTVGVNGAYNRNKVGRIPNDDGIIHGLDRQLYDNAPEFYRAQNGLPIGYFWGLETDGLFQTEADVVSHRSSEGKILQPDARPGDVRYKDRNDDGAIDNLDRTMIGNPNPDYTFGITASANYKGFDLSVLANGVAGNQIVQSYRNHASQYANYTTAILDRWHGPGSSNTMPRVTETANNWTNFSDLYIHDGDFMRISNITLGYNFSSLLNKKFISQLRVYASVQNLYTFTKYEGMDPEVGYGTDNVDYSNATDPNAAKNITDFSSGIDLGYYPRPRTYMIGVNVKF